MPARLRSESGFLLIELLIAMVVLTIAVLALAASYDEGFFSLRSSAKTSSAGVLAQNQLELYASLLNTSSISLYSSSYASIGFTSAALSAAKSASGSTYTADENALLPTGGLEVTVTTCATSPQCSPVQTVTGGDGRSYQVETFIRTLSNPSSSGRTEKIVSVVVRDLKAGDAKVVTMQTGFDSGPGG